MTNSGQLQAQLLDWNPGAGGRFVRFRQLIIITTLPVIVMMIVTSQMEVALHALKSYKWVCGDATGSNVES